MDKSEKITFRCTPEQKGEICSNALKENKSVSEYIADTLLKTKSRRKQINKRELEELCKLASLVSKIEDGYEKEKSTKNLVKEVKNYVRCKNC